MSEEKTQGPWTEDDIGNSVTIVTETGTYFDERIVQVFCPICAGAFIGPIREAGGFISAHDSFHRYESDRTGAIAHGFTP